MKQLLQIKELLSSCFLKLFFSFFRKQTLIVWLLFAITPCWAALDTDPKEILIKVSNVPINEPSIFIPLSISSEELDLDQIKLKDIFIKGYLANIERDENKKVIGISFAALRSKNLPETLEAIIKLKHIRPAEAIPKDYPKTVAINWQSPWVFTKVTKKIPKSYAGFDGFSLAVNQDKDLITKQELKQKRKEQENKASDFYVKSFGQPLFRGQRRNKKDLVEQEFIELPILKELEFFALTPPEGSYEKLYIPITVNKPELLKIEITESGLAQGTVLRMLNNNLLELVGLNNSFLPNNAFLRGKLRFLENEEEKSLLNSVKLGPILAEPSRPLAEIQVFITPNIITIKYTNFNPLNLF